MLNNNSSKMKVLFASAEAAPFSKVGGMADVVGSLPAALRRVGTDARVIMPAYGSIDHEKYGIEHWFSFTFARRTGSIEVQVYRAEYEDVPFYFVQSYPFFHDGDKQVYSTWEWDMPRFIFFNQAALAVAWEIQQRDGWFPDVWHVNDWHTGLIPFLLAANRDDPNWANVGSLLSIHNLAYQGEGAGGWLYDQGIPPRANADLVYQNLTDNLLAIAIAYSDMVTTVSPRYAIEIQYPSFMQHGLDGLIRTRVDDLYGILNGLDVDAWNPETDPLLVSNYNAENFPEKRPANKRELQIDAGLEVRADIPIIGIVSRLVWQKGFDLAIPALQRLLVSTDAQLIVLGSGEPDLEYQFWRLGQDFSWRAKVFQGYNAAVAQKIYAGSDLFLMPSHYEPCGIGQMIAMRYGSLPLVRETGGLADTVENYDNGSGDKGKGFVFNWEQPDAVLNTLRWAINTYRNNQPAWQQMQKRAMETDFSWDKSAQDYIELYSKALLKRKGENIS
jgi:starch synthase